VFESAVCTTVALARVGKRVAETDRLDILALRRIDRRSSKSITSITQRGCTLARWGRPWARRQWCCPLRPKGPCPPLLYLPGLKRRSRPSLRYHQSWAPLLYHHARVAHPRMHPVGMHPAHGPTHHVPVEGNKASGAWGAHPRPTHGGMGGPVVWGPMVWGPMVGVPVVWGPLVGVLLVGPPLVGGPLVPPPLVGGPLVGDPLVGGPLVGGPLVACVLLERRLGRRIWREGSRVWREGSLPLPLLCGALPLSRNRRRRGRRSGPPADLVVLGGEKTEELTRRAATRVKSVGALCIKKRTEWYGGAFLLLQQRSKHLREMVITSKASTSS